MGSSFTFTGASDGSGTPAPWAIGAVATPTPWAIGAVATLTSGGDITWPGTVTGIDASETAWRWQFEKLKVSELITTEPRWCGLPVGKEKAAGSATGTPILIWPTQLSVN